MANYMDQGFFCGTGFSGSMAPYEMMPHMSRDHHSWVEVDGNHVIIPNLIEMISTTTPMIRASAHVPEP